MISQETGAKYLSEYEGDLVIDANMLREDFINCLLEEGKGEHIKDSVHLLASR